ncbi:Cupredoxin [Guyanagaster necrorhizus]|uniref:Cupredoxin n=1 Tax=Guyanagaster necrorhizus TaxID=856835 RepID=A0A9P7W5F4_9AGAR|nr:Cupredoxin [Guyanagaster necrorhizus MCA 3950]KAG7452800.1 Cupredoxin [Guyanagaster necrorhizus MCA 3950]
MPQIFISALKAIILAGFCSAAARAADINVTVGGPGVLKFSPDSVTANVGDVLRFTFMQKNHTATQSTLASPCSPIENGFDSGFVPVSDNTTSGFPVAELTISDTNPIWVYCRQANHCQQGMVFAVNPGDKLAQFQAAATGNTTATASSGSSATSAATGVVTVTATSVTVSGGQVLTTTSATTAATASVSSSSSTDHKVIVGGTGGLVTYSPANITANVGDTVTFEFHQKNHTVTASSFASPCQALSGGFNSGFMPVTDDAQTFPTYTVQVNDTKPIWAYCMQTNHCAQGMVFAVNANESSANTFEAFKAKAMSNSTSTSSSSGAASSSTGSASGAAGLAARGSGAVAIVFAIALGCLL